MTPKKGRPLNLELTGRQKRVFRARAGRETPAHKWPHLSARRGVLAVWPLALHITLQALRYDPEYPSLAPTKVDMTFNAHAVSLQQKMVLWAASPSLVLGRCRYAPRPIDELGKRGEISLVLALGIP